MPETTSMMRPSTSIPTVEYIHRVPGWNCSGSRAYSGTARPSVIRSSFTINGPVEAGGSPTIPDVCVISSRTVIGCAGFFRIGLPSACGSAAICPRNSGR